MKSLSRIFRILLAAASLMIFTVCGTTAQASAPALPGNNPYATQPGDAALLRRDVQVVSADVSLAESYPPQVMLHFAYFQPTPCYKLRVEISQPDAQSRIHVSASAVTEKDKVCTLMALSTPLQASMNLGSFPKGHYSVWLNGASVGEFDS